MATMPPTVRQVVVVVAAVAAGRAERAGRVASVPEAFSMATAVVAVGHQDRA